MGLALQNNSTTDLRPDISIGHLGLKVQDLNKSQAFFELVGGRTVVRMPSMAIIELRGGTHLILRSDKNAASTYANFDLMTDDIDVMHQRLVESGYKPSDISRGGVHRTFEVTDFSGLTFDITSSHATGPV